ncbi:MAG: MATE family efflux transporter, partial [Clostridiales bacterium]|nr:MATE family efflux transporter [Clostridiales bacterium]
MTKGKPMSLMLRFSLPLLFTNVLQLVYTLADAAVVGRVLGVTALGAVGATSSLHWLVLSSVIGVTQGFSTVFAQRMGAGDKEGLRKAFPTAVILAAALGIVIGGAGVLGGGAVLRLMETPPELQEDAAVYLRILLGGMPVTFAYNLLGGVLRGLGDSKTPLRAMILASVLNIALDIALAYPLGVAGVAIATLLAQGFACVFCYIALQKTGMFTDTVLRWDGGYAKALLRLGLPAGFRNAVIEAGGLVVQRYVNLNGAEFVAGVAAAKRMYSLLTCAAGAVEAAVATFVAQNFGVPDYERIKQGVAAGFRMMMVSAGVIIAITLPLGRLILALMIDGEPERVKAVLDAGTAQLRTLVLGQPVLFMLFLYRSALQGMGNAFVPMLSGFVESAVRVLSAVALTPVIGVWAVYLSDPLDWAAALGLLA